MIKRDTERAALRWLGRVVLALLLLGAVGCFPGQFPTPTPRNPPPVQTNGNQGQTPHFYGAPSPTWQSADAGGG